MNQQANNAPESLLYASSAAIYLDDFKDPATALQYYNKALELGYSEDVCLAGIARCHLQLGDHEQSYAYYTRYIEAGYFSVGISVNYAFLLMQRGKFSGALQCLEKAFQLAADDNVRAELQKYLDHTRSRLHEER